MSLIKSIMHQLGLSGDPAKNFTLSVPAAPDGTMKLARGNAGATTQDIMTVDAAGKVAFPQGIQSNITLGAFQSVPVGGLTVSAIPSGVKRLTIGISKLQCATDVLTLLQLGTSGALKTSGYVGSNYGNILHASSSFVGTETSSFSFYGYDVAVNGTIMLNLIDAATNTWQYQFIGGITAGTPAVVFGTGLVSLASELAQLRIKAISGNFASGGNVSVSWEK